MLTEITNHTKTIVLNGQELELPYRTDPQTLVEEVLLNGVWVVLSSITKGEASE